MSPRLSLVLVLIYLIRRLVMPLNLGNELSLVGRLFPSTGSLLDWLQWVGGRRGGQRVRGMCYHICGGGLVDWDYSDESSV